MMKIGMILDEAFPPDSRVENEALALIGAGHKVALFSLNLNGKENRSNHSGIEVYRYPFNGWLYKKLSPLAYTFPFYHLLLKKHIKAFIKKVNPDVLHIHNMIIADAVFDINGEFGLPVVVDLHENKPEIMKAYTHVNSGIGKYLIDIKKWQSKQKEVVLKADKIIVVTPESREDLVKESGLSEDKITVVPNSVDEKVFYEYPLHEDIINDLASSFSLLYLGHTGLRRGLDTAIASVALLKKSSIEVRLVVVGKSRDDRKLREMVREMNVADRVEFRGWQDISYFPSYIKGASVCLSPLHRNRHHDTTYANKIFQYMAMGKPMIVSDCPAQVHVAEDCRCGLVHEAGNAKDLADKIEILYKDEALRKKMAEAGLKAFKNKYVWNKMNRELLYLYEAGIGENAAGK